jgi:two-component system LytT family sensor kinase
MFAETTHSPAGRPNWFRVWVGLLGLWAAFAIQGTFFNYETFLTRNRAISWTQAIRMNLTAYGIWAFLLTPIVLFLCSRLELDRRRLFKLVSAHLVAVAAAASIDVCIKTLLGGLVFPGAQSHPFGGQFHKYFASEAEADVQIYLLIAVIGYVVAYYSKLRMQERHAADLETNLVKAELQLLKTQLQPHFLFNTLHSVAALVRKDPQAAEKMICSLGDLLRLTLAAEDTPKVPLRRELDFLRMYLDIQKVRFRDRLVTEINIEPQAMDTIVPYLLLQPLVENAIKHGVARRPGKGKVEVEIRKDTDMLSISVVNDKGSAQPVPAHERFGIGLENIRCRMRILYDSRGELVCRELPGERFQVEVRIPIEGIPAPQLEAVLVSSVV